MTVIMISWVDSFIETYGLVGQLTLMQRDTMREMTNSILSYLDKKEKYDSLLDHLNSSTLYDCISSQPWFESAVAFATGWINVSKHI